MGSTLDESLVRTAAIELMSAEADSLCGASLGEVSEHRVDRRCGYRSRNWQTGTGTIKLIIPRLRTGSYSPDWLLEDPPRAERALLALVAGAQRSGISARRVMRLTKELGITGIPRDRAALIAETLNRAAAESGERPEPVRPVAPERSQPTWRFYLPYAVLGIGAVAALVLLLAPISAGSMLLIQLVVAGYLCAGLAMWANGRAAGTGSAPPGTPRTHFLSW